jgi:hypothetical protein
MILLPPSATHYIFVPRYSEWYGRVTGFLSTHTGCQNIFRLALVGVLFVIHQSMIKLARISTSSTSQCNIKR